MIGPSVCTLERLGHIVMVCVRRGVFWQKMPCRASLECPLIVVKQVLFRDPVMMAVVSQDRDQWSRRAVRVGDIYDGPVEDVFHVCWSRFPCSSVDQYVSWW